jgi:hypothetical protein
MVTHLSYCRMYLSAMVSMLNPHLLFTSSFVFFLRRCQWLVNTFVAYPLLLTRVQLEFSIPPPASLSPSIRTNPLANLSPAPLL